MCCANVESSAHLFIQWPFARQFWDLILGLFVGLLLCPMTFWTSSTLLWRFTHLLVARRLFGGLFFGLSFGLYGASVIGVFFKTLFHLLVIFSTWYCPRPFIGAELGTLLKILAYQS